MDSFIIFLHWLNLRCVYELTRSVIQTSYIQFTKRAVTLNTSVLDNHDDKVVALFHPAVMDNQPQGNLKKQA
jgi:hypothetical protein